jgi:hypothetical protein
MSELMLDMGLVDLGRRGQPGTQRMVGEGQAALALGQVAADARRQRGALDQTRDMPVIEPVRPDAAVFPGDPPEHRAMGNPPEPDPGLQRRDRTASVRGAARDLDYPPAGLALDAQQDPLGQDLDPAGPVDRLVGPQIEPDDLGATLPAGKAQQQGRAVAKAAQGLVQCLAGCGKTLPSEERP